MLNLKKRILRGYMLLGICLISLGTNYSNIESEKTQINKFVASKYQGNSNMENADSKESLGETTENSSNKVDEIPIKAQEAEITLTKSQEIPFVSSSLSDPNGAVSNDIF